MPKRIAKAPYRFVPLHKEVVHPYWERAISHDQPFLDNHSGTIAVTMTACADIMVSDGRKTPDNNMEVLKFSNFKGRYFIPSTSLKGMIRNMMEIMSFGSMQEKVEDNRYAFRDVGRSKNEYLREMNEGDILCGYLRKDGDGNYAIRSCGIPGRISQENISADMATFFSGGRGSDYNPSRDSCKSAKFKNEKYEAYTRDPRHFDFLEKDNGRLIFEQAADGDRIGKIVFTGQPSPNNLFVERGNGKHFEFIFFEDRDEPTYEVKPEVIKDFKFAYFDHDKMRWSIDWEENREKLNKGLEIPVFFKLKTEKDTKVVAHLGLSYLYKLPFKHSVHDTIKHTQKNAKLDLAETIFGHISNLSHPLKSRVSFSHAWADENARETTDTRIEVLSSPKASYFPFYLKQKSSKVVSYMGKSAEVAGWKRYPVHTSLKNNRAPNGNQNIAVRFKPLEEGATFTFSISYHNLRTMELGALLSALTFHGKMNEEEAGIFHSIGMAKPLGYGKVKLKIDSEINQEAYMEEFENYMNVALRHEKPAWHNSMQIQKLFALSTENNEMNANLKYMELPEFPTVKNGTKFLRPYENTERYIPRSLSTEGSIQQFKSWMQEDQIKMESIGDVHQVIHDLQLRERRLFKAKFEERKAELLLTLEQKRKEQREIERATKEKQRLQQEKDKLERIKENDLAVFLKDKNFDQITNPKSLKTFKNLIAEYTSKRYNCNRNKLREERPEGYLVDSADIQAVDDHLSTYYTSKGQKVQKDFRKSFEEKKGIFRDLINWVGEKEALRIFNNIIT